VGAKDKVASVPSGRRHIFVIRPPRWVGQNRNLFNDYINEFTEFIPLHPRGAQVLIDPFDARAGEVSITGRIVSPAKVLNPAAQIEAWCDGVPITLDEDLISTTTSLHSGTDQIHIRARDDTGLQGRAYVCTWTPKQESDELVLDAQAGGFEEQEPPFPINTSA